jgi:uncharacterized protein YraI
MVLIFLFVTSCNLPVGGVTAVNEEQALPSNTNVNTVATSVELTVMAKMTQSADLATPPTATSTASAAATEVVPPTVCVPQVTSTTNANVRAGPDVVYDVVGNLPLGSTAAVAGRNEANTWWYINFAGGVGGYAWIAGSVVTTSCLPSAVKVVAAPPTPIVPTSVPPTPTFTQAPEVILAPPVAGTPDLVASGMQYWPSPAKNNEPVSIQVKVTNSGNAPAGSFAVSWLSNQNAPGCDWTVQGLGVGASQNLDCEFTYHGNATASYWITLVVDTGNQVAESNEGNNSRDGKLQVKP